MADCQIAVLRGDISDIILKKNNWLFSNFSTISYNCGKKCVL